MKDMKDMKDMKVMKVMKRLFCYFGNGFARGEARAMDG